MRQVWADAVEAMDRLTTQYAQTVESTSTCVHRQLVLRAMALLEASGRQTVCALLAPWQETLLCYAKMPDQDGDPERGLGRHYYCAWDADSSPERAGRRGYYRNGIGRYAKSARSMLEEDYTTALTLWHGGEQEAAVQFLGRAVHMLSDLCCLPHSTGMTYFSSCRKVHKAYERLAEAMYPDVVEAALPDPEAEASFQRREGFADAIHAETARMQPELSLLQTNPAAAITGRLQRTEQVLAAFLLRFAADVALPPETAHYCENGASLVLRTVQGMLPFGEQALTVQVTAAGIRLQGRCGLLTVQGRSVRLCGDSDPDCTLFRPAHRLDGLFTLSPVCAPDGRVLLACGSGCRLRRFDPDVDAQLFHL